MYDFIAIDFETANNNLVSACSIGLVKVKNNIVVDTDYFLIRPPTMYFNLSNIAIHGITPDMVRNALSFQGVWEQINSNFQGDEIIVAHNAQFDMSVLMNCIIHYNLPLPDFTYVCSIPISTKACAHNVPKSLVARAEYFGIALDNHHNALDDAMACAQLVIKSIEAKRKQNLSKYCSTYRSIQMRNFSELNMQKFFIKKHYNFERISISEITATNQEFNEEHLFFGKSVVLTGNLESMDRKSAMQSIADVGGINKSAVSRKTDYLIVGNQDIALVGNDGMSTKEEKAYDLIKKGFDIEIINEADFLSILAGDHIEKTIEG